MAPREQSGGVGLTRRPLHEANGQLIGSTDASGGEAVETGTTIVALAAEDAVVLGADRRASLGGRLVTNKDTRKVERLHPTAAAALSGTVGHLQQFVRILRSESRLYADRRGSPPGVEALGTLAGNVLRSSGLQVQPLLGGVDESGAHVLELDGGGGVMGDAYAAGGSGMQFAYGVLENEYEDGMRVADARAAAAAAIENASERDTASGNGVTLATVTREGVRIDDDAAPGEVA